MRIFIEDDPDGRMPISVIVSAYNVAPYLEECLSSIFDQNYQDGLEVLVGVDSCGPTRDKFNQIKHMFPGVKGFWFPRNVGTYVVSNTLAGKAQHSTLMRFDSDDVMLPGMMSRIRNFARSAPVSIINCHSISFWQGSDREQLNTHPCEGQSTMSLSLWQQLGGWRGWRCAADTDFIARATSGGAIRKTLTGGPGFRRRIRSGSLTQNRETGMGSVLRNRYASRIRHKPEHAGNEQAHCHCL